MNFVNSYLVTSNSVCFLTMVSVLIDSSLSFSSSLINERSFLSFTWIGMSMSCSCKYLTSTKRPLSACLHVSLLLQPASQICQFWQPTQSSFCLQPGMQHTPLNRCLRPISRWSWITVRFVMNSSVSNLVMAFFSIIENNY